MKVPKNKINPFIEKIADIKIAQQETELALALKNHFDFLPTTLTLFCEVDFLNIQPNKDYILYIYSSHKSVPDFTPINATRVVIQKEQMIMTSASYGIAQGTLTFDLPIMEDGSYALAFELEDVNSNSLDVFYRYFYFTKGN